MVRHLREGKAVTGLLYGQGEFVTKHHATLLSRAAPTAKMNADYKVQLEVDRRRGRVPALLTEYRGFATIESHTVIYDRGGAPLYGISIARTVKGDRAMARVDKEFASVLTDSERSPIGVTGHIAPDDRGLLHWEF
jgi:hypothetical protein